MSEKRMNRRELLVALGVAPFIPLLPSPALSEASLVEAIERYGFELESIRPTKLLVQIPCKPMNHFVLVGLPAAYHSSGIVLDKGDTASASPGKMVDFYPHNAMWIKSEGLHYAVVPDWALR